MFNGRTQDRLGLSACKDRYFQTALLKSSENTCPKAGEVYNDYKVSNLLGTGVW